ncbi:MAG: hypothetical protein ACOCW7_04280 [Bacteroidota bacterium]
MDATNKISVYQILNQMKISKYNFQNRFYNLNTYLIAFYFLFLIFAVFQHHREWEVKKSETKNNEEIKNSYVSNHYFFDPAGADVKIRVYFFDSPKIYSQKD